MSDKKPIAEITIFAVDHESREFEIQAAVGVPYETDSGEWACPLTLEGYLGLNHNIYGVDSWQSLVLAQRIVHNILSYFVADGGKLFWEKGGEEISVAELYGDVEETREPDWPPTEEQQARIDELARAYPIDRRSDPRQRFLAVSKGRTCCRERNASE